MIEIDIEKKLLSAQGPMCLKVNFCAREREFISLFGPSGVGKTSLLRILAGLLPPDSGYLKVRDQLWYDGNGLFVPPQKRSIGMVFQDYALFPHLTIRQNLEFAMEHRKERSFVDYLLETVDLWHLQNRRPDSLSGGQKQRVALARALVRKPDLLLLDEPLSALDSATREKLQQELRKLHSELGTTTIMVSHDIAEICKLAQRVLLFESDGSVVDTTPEKAFIKKNEAEKMRFIGEILQIEANEAIVLIANCPVEVTGDTTGYNVGDKVIVRFESYQSSIIGRL